MEEKLEKVLKSIQELDERLKRIEEAVTNTRDINTIYAESVKAILLALEIKKEEIRT